MKRLTFVALAFLFGCSGIGNASRQFVPSTPLSGADATHATAATTIAAPRRGRHVPVQVRMTIPRRHRGEHMRLHPASISSSTQSVGIAINSAAQQVFNTTPTSPGCSIGVSGTTCTFTVSAPIGTDTFTVTTFSATGGGGIALDHGVATVPIVKGQLNTPRVTLGPVVSTTADSGMGSLRYAIATANAGDTIMFLLPANSVVTLGSPIAFSTAVNISGPGVTSSSRSRSGRVGPDVTFSGLTISGANSHQVFIVKTGVTVSISGLVITAGQASVAHQPGGAISNKGTLLLASDAVTNSTSLVTNVRGADTHRPDHHALAPSHTPRLATRVPNGRRFPHACTVSEQFGGGLYNNGTLTITDTTFDSDIVSDNCAGNGEGGAIYNDTNGSLFVTNSTFSNNAAGYGGAIYNGGTNGQATFTGDVFTGNGGCTAANGCATSGCSLTTSCTTSAYGYGSAIYDADGPGVTIATSAFTNNVAGGNSPSSNGEGGALYLDTGSPVITGSAFTGNLAGGGSSNCSNGYGGAIYESASNTLELDNDTFTSNVASGDEDGYGGAVYNNSNPDHGSGNTFTSNVAFANGSACETYPYAYGSALYAYYGINMSGSTFNNNAATAGYEVEGGTIYTDSPSNLSGNTFTGNTATTTSLTGEDGYIYGGVIENDKSLKLSNNTFSGNAANAGGLYGYYVYGGVLYDSGGLSSTGNTFTGTKTSTTYPDDGYVYGGVIYASSILSSSGDAFRSNMPTSSYEVYGGGIYSTGNTTLNVNSDTFASNVSSSIYVDGGAIGVDSYGPNTITNSTFTANAVGSGTQQAWSGAIETDQDAGRNGTTISGSTFAGNSATSGAGAIGDYSYVSGTGIEVTNSVFTGNVVTNALNGYGGGAINTEGSDPLVVLNSTFTGNAETAAQVGTGGGAISNENGLILEGSTLSGNSAVGSISGTGGGGIISFETALIYNSTITGNASAEDGGGIEQFANHPIALISDTIYKNSATGNGGNIENPYTVGIANTIVAGGSAGGVGPDVDNSGGTLTSQDYNLIQAPIAGNPMATPNPDHDLAGVDPVLLALANNGGPTFTNADTATSPGKAYIPFSGSTCGTIGGDDVDQRGYSRGAGGKCDIGAYEFGGVASALRTHFPVIHGHNRPLPRAPKKPKHDPHLNHNRSSYGAK
jgi:hypothetical protein